jgi:hypothetical protein
MQRFAVLCLPLALAACGKSKDSTPAAGSGSAGSAVAGDATAAAPIDLSAFAVPEVAAHGYESNPPAPRVIATSTAIIVDGKQVLALEAGAVPASAIVDGKLPAVVGGLSAAAPGAGPRMVVALDKSLTYEMLSRLLTTLQSQGVRSFGLLARAKGASVMLPIEVPDSSGASVTSVEPPSGTRKRLGASVEVADATVSPESSLSGELVKVKVSGAYLTPVKRCVAKIGPRDASPGGTLALSFAVDETGRAADPSVTGLPKDVADCITASMLTWRFPVPKGPDREGVRVNAKVMLSMAFHELGPRDAVDDGDGAAAAGSAAPPAAAKAPAAAPVEPDAPKLQMVVTVTANDVSVWSISGLEGTLAAPRKRVATGAAAGRDVSAALEDIVKRRWSRGAPRSAANREIIVIADASVSMQALAEILGAVRASSSGAELFPAVVLGTSVK